MASWTADATSPTADSTLVTADGREPSNAATSGGVAFTWTIDGWCGYATNCTIDGWPRTGLTFTIDGWVADSGDTGVDSDVGGPLFREGYKKRRIEIPEAPRIDFKELAAKARIKRFERMASKAAAKALQAAKRAEQLEIEAKRIAAETAAREASEAKRKASEERAIATALQEAAKSRAKAKKLAEEAAEKARVLAAEEMQRASDEKTLTERLMPQLLKELDAVDAKFGDSIGEVLSLLDEEREELETPEPKEKGPTKIQQAALEALQAILETTKRIH